MTQNPNFSPTPYNHDWVNRYNVVLSHDHEFGDGWLLQATGWFTYQEVDNRTAAALGPNGELPATTTIQSENYYNGGADIRLRKRWGEEHDPARQRADFRRTVIYHGDAPFEQFINPDLFADRGRGRRSPDSNQDRNSNYQAFFAENIFRFGRFHVVPSFRLDHESVEVNEIVTPFDSTARGRQCGAHCAAVGHRFGQRFPQGQRDLLQRLLRLAADALLRCRLTLLTHLHSRASVGPVYFTRLRAGCAWRAGCRPGTLV